METLIVFLHIVAFFVVLYLIRGRHLEVDERRKFIAKFVTFTFIGSMAVLQILYFTPWFVNEFFGSGMTSLLSESVLTVWGLSLFLLVIYSLLMIYKSWKTLVIIAISVTILMGLSTFAWANIFAGKFFFATILWVISVIVVRFFMKRRQFVV